MSNEDKSLNKEAFQGNPENASKDLVDPSAPINLQKPDIDLSSHRYECRSCGYVYDPAEGVKKFDIPVGTAFADLAKSNFRCPVCRVGIDGFKDIGPVTRASGFTENLNYGLGVNNLTSGQKNVLIFGSLAFALACFLSLYSLN